MIDVIFGEKVKAMVADSSPCNKSKTGFFVFRHTMELKEECPVRHLAFMEPENDPREMVYIWVGQNDSEGARGYATLLSLSYSHKEPSLALQKFHYSVCMPP